VAYHNELATAKKEEEAASEKLAAAAGMATAGKE